MDVNIINDVAVKNDVLAIILSSIVPIAISVVALFFSVKTATYTKKKQKIQNALTQAAEYRKILEHTSFLNVIMHDEKHKNILDIINSVDKKQMNQFTTEEAKKLFKDDYGILEDFFENKDFDESVVYKNCIAFTISTSGRMSFSFDSVEFFDNVERHYILNRVFQREIIEILNFLEHFAMSFNQNLSDEDVVYQSLHKTYIDIVRRLYWVITSYNPENNIADKSFTNIINLFINWRDKSGRKAKGHTDPIKPGLPK